MSLNDTVTTGFIKVAAKLIAKRGQLYRPAWPDVSLAHYLVPKIQLENEDPSQVEQTAYPFYRCADRVPKNLKKVLQIPTR